MMKEIIMETFHMFILCLKNMCVCRGSAVPTVFYSPWWRIEKVKDW